MESIKKIIITSFIILLLSSCSNRSDGVFKVVDGKEIFVSKDGQVIDKLVHFDGEEYYIGENGSKIKNDWAIIDNDGQYAYFGAKGIMIKNQIKEIDGSLFYFDVDGKLVTDRYFTFEDKNYYATKDGYLLRSQFKTIDDKDKFFDFDGKEFIVSTPSWVNNYNLNGLGDFAPGYYYLDADGNIVKNKWVDEYYLTDTGLMAEKTSSKNVESVSAISWSMDTYVDDFNDATTDRYIKGIFTGTFSNSATKNSTCDYVFLIGKDYVDLMIYQYGTFQVKNVDMGFDITAKNKNKETYTFSASMYIDSDRLYIDREGTNYIIENLIAGNIIKLSIKDSMYSSYIVELNPTGFVELYNAL